MDLQLMVTNLHSTRALPWNNMEELSSLWAVFTKCKRQFRNGFRLENMTWRLWYRQAIMGKQTRPAITTEPDLAPISATPSSSSSAAAAAAAATTTPRLSRSRSLPDLSMHYAQHAHSFNTPDEADRPAAVTSPSKFYIDRDRDDDDDDYDTIGSSSVYDDDSYWAAAGATTATTFSSSPSSIMTDEDDAIADVEAAALFTKQETPCSVVTGLKPESLLSKMFQQEQEAVFKKTHEPLSISGGLRRCQSRFNQLDEWFSKAV